MGEGDLKQLKSDLRLVSQSYLMKAFGLADLQWLRTRYPEELEGISPRFTCGVAMGIRLPQAVLEEIADHPTPLYFHAYRQANYQLDRGAYAVADRLQGLGYQAMAVPASQIIADDPMRALLSHRLVGWAAGLGWWGRNNLLVNPRFGSQVRYVTVLTDAELEPDEPLEADCGACMACVEVCPAGAIQVERDQFDLARCKAKLDEFRKLPYVSQHICGVCLKACSPQAVQQALGSREETGGSDTSA